MEIKKVYVLTADTNDESYGLEIELFGVFSTEEKAENQASEINLYNYEISCVKIDETKKQFYLGGFFE